MRRLLFLFAVMLAACGERRPPAPTEAENQQLDEADALLNDAAKNEGR